MCFICQDFKINLGHETKFCPKNTCKKCGKKGHTKMGCMIDYKDLPLPNEILFKIFSYLPIQDLHQCSLVSKRLREICLSDKFEKYNLFLQTIDELKEKIGESKRVFNLRSSLALPLTQRMKDWQVPFLPEVRNYVIFRLILATLPKLESILVYYRERDIEKVQHKDKRMTEIIGYAKRMELERYQKSADQTEYFQQIQERVKKIEEKRKELKRKNEEISEQNKRLRGNEAMPEGQRNK